MPITTENGFVVTDENGNVFFPDSGKIIINQSGINSTGVIHLLAPLSGTTAEFTTITAENIIGNLTIENAAYVNANNNFVGTNTFTSYITGSITGSVARFTSITGSFSGNGSNITNLNYSNISNPPSIPTVGNATVTIAAGNGLTDGGFLTTNQTGNSTITLNVGAGTGISVANDSVAIDTTVVPTLAANNSFTGTNTFSSPVIASITGNSATSTKLQTSRTIQISGDVVGSTSFDGSANVVITSTLSNSGVTAGTYRSVTVDSKGRVTAGTNPTTADGYGLTDVVKLSGNQTVGGIKTFSSTITGSITGSDAKFTSITGSFSGNGSGITNINYSNISNPPSIPTVGNATVTIAAGNGLVNGGSLTTNQTTNSTITLNVGAGTGITVAADSVGIDTAVVPRLDANNSFTSANTFTTITASNINVDTIVAREYHTQLVSASVIYQSGSTKFGDTPGGATQDTHQFSGSIYITGSNVTLTGGVYSGNGSGLTNIQYSNIVGTPTVGNATVEISAGDGLQTGGSFTTNQTIASTITLDVDSTVVRTTGDQTLGGAKQFTSYITGSVTGSDAKFASVTGSFKGNIVGNASSATTLAITQDNNSLSLAYIPFTTVSANGNRSFSISNTGLTYFPSTSVLSANYYRSGIGSDALPAYGPSSDADTGMFYPEENTVAITTGGTEKIRIHNNGAVTIGSTAATSNMLHVNGNGYVTGYLDVDGDNSGTAMTINGKVTINNSILRVSDGGIEATGTTVFSGNGSGLTNINASNLSGIIPTSSLPSTVVYSDTAQTIDGAKQFSSYITGSITGSDAKFTTITGSLSGNSSTASKLQTARNLTTIGDIIVTINNFDGSNNVQGTAVIDSGKITDSHIKATANISDTKLATISTSGKVSNSATTATSNNTANAIVARDSSGNFSAGTITASLAGNASTVTNGVYTVGDQTINGIKTFNDSIVGNLVGIADNATYAISAGEAASANNTQTVAITDDTSSIAIRYLTFVDGTSGNNALKVDSSTLTYNPNSNTLLVSNIQGNANTATTLYNSRLINGTNFNGSTNITTAQWGASRNITIGNTTRSINGSTNYSWSLSDIGAAGLASNNTFTATNVFNNDIQVNTLTVGKGNSNLSSNTAFGINALSETVSAAEPPWAGKDNTAIGNDSQPNTTLGYKNTSIGSETLSQNTTGSLNTAIGYRAGYSLSNGSSNLFLGSYAGSSETNLDSTTIISIGSGTERLRIDSSGNVSIGATNALGYKLYVNGAIYSPGGITAAVFFGDGSGITNISPDNIGNGTIPAVNLPSTVVYSDTVQTITETKTFSKDIYVGSNKIGQGNASSYNVSFGQGNLLAYSAYSYAQYNVSLGYYSNYWMYSGYYNIGIGYYSGFNLSSGYGNTTLGYYSGFNLTSENYNVILGYESMRYLRGSYNVALGYRSLRSTSNYTNSDYNVAIGAYAGESLQGSSDNNVFIGPYAGSGETSLNNTIIFSAGSGKERMRIDSDGNIGIGIAPISSNKLYVSGGITSTTYMYAPSMETDNLIVNDNITIDGVYTGNGSGITNINGSNINNGSITNTKLSSSYIKFGTIDVELGDTIEIGSGLAYSYNGYTGNLYLGMDSNSVLLTNTDQTIISIKTFNEQIKVKPGTTASMSIVSSGDQDTGIYFPGNGTMGVVSNATERFRFANNGALGVNTNNPLSTLHVFSGSVTYHRDQEADLIVQGGDCHLQLASTDSGFGSALLLTNGAKHWFVHHQTGSVLEFRSHTTTGDGNFIGSSTNRMTLDSSGNLWIGGTFTEASTRRIKKNIRSLGSQLANILKLNPVSYERKDIENGKAEIGLIAEEVGEVYPEFVNGEGVNYSKMVSVLVSAVKELTEKVEQQDKLIKQLMSK